MTVVVEAVCISTPERRVAKQPRAEAYVSAHGFEGDRHAGETRTSSRTGQPVPNLAPLLWDAAAIVTETGSPAAHLFESARALRVPAVCGVTIPPGDWIVAGDGQAGVVATIPLAGDDDV